MAAMTIAPDLTAFQPWLEHRETATELLSAVPIALNVEIKVAGRTIYQSPVS